MYIYIYTDVYLYIYIVKLSSKKQGEEKRGEWVPQRKGWRG